MRIIDAAIAGPTIGAVLVTGLVLVAGLFDDDPLWPVEDLTLAEAAFLRDDGEVARLIALGENPNGHYRIRRTLMDESPDLITPLEAAVRANRAVMVRLLLAHGALPDGRTWTAVCESEGDEIHDIRALLEPLTPSMSCGTTKDADRAATLR
jgi:hypothetical protein